jgi:hypothetical protein
METRYEVIIADDSDHEMVFAEVYCDNRFLAIVSQEDGTDHLKVELPGPNLDESQVVRQVFLADFVVMLDEAAKKLLRKA